MLLNLNVCTWFGLNLGLDSGGLARPQPPLGDLLRLLDLLLDVLVVDFDLTLDHVVEVVHVESARLNEVQTGWSEKV